MSEYNYDERGNPVRKEKGKVEHVSAGEDGSIKREVKEVETNLQPRSEGHATGSWGEGDRTDKNGWLMAGMAEDKQSRDPEGFEKEDHRQFERGERDKKE